MTNSELEAFVEQAKQKATQKATSELEAIVEKAKQKAIAESEKLAKREAERLRTDRKTVMANWKERQKARRQEEREARARNGRQLAESFVQRVSADYLRMTQDPKALEALQSIRITFIPGKSDQAPSPSAAIFDGTKRLSTIYNASLGQLQERETRLTDNLKEKTGFQGTTPIEMLEEIARLQEQMDNRGQQADELSSIATAAHEVLLVRASGGDLEQAMDNLEQMFLPRHKRESNLAPTEPATEA
mgnify:CR=1 FL=1|jgi:hypothetical protein